MPVPTRHAGALALSAALGLGALALAFQSGGFFAGSTGIAEAAAAAGLAGWILFARRPLAGLSLWLGLAVAGLGAFALWALVSGGWSHAPARALLEGDRALLYAMVVALTGLIAVVPRVRSALPVVLTAGMVIVAVCALITRLLPDLWPVGADVEFERLSFPLGYWNAQGAIGGLAAIGCLHLAAGIDRSRVTRSLAAAALPLVATSVFLTFSRGAIGAAAVGIVVYLVLARPRGAVAALLAIIPATTIAVAAAATADAVVQQPTVTQAGIDAGRTVAAVVAICALAAGAGLLALTRLEPRLTGWRRPRVPHGRAVAAALVTVVIAGTIASGAAARVIDRAGELTRSTHVDETGDGRQRLTQLSDNGRIDAWRASLQAFEANPFHGSGAGTFALTWAQERPNIQEVNDGHSLLFETLGELGIVGTALLLLGLGALAAGCIAVLRSPGRRAAGAAGLAILLAWMVHACVDWDWEMPALTLPALAFAAASVGTSREPEAPRHSRSGWAARGVAAAALLAIGAMGAGIAISQHRLDEAVAAVHADRCAAAVPAARGALDVYAQRPEPHQVLAVCAMRDGDATTALAQMQAALALDPRNWRLVYNVAIIRALQGQDPRPALREARRLNPRSWLLRQAAEAMYSSDPDDWRRVALRASLLV